MKMIYVYFFPDKQPGCDAGQSLQEGTGFFRKTLCLLRKRTYFERAKVEIVVKVPCECLLQYQLWMRDQSVEYVKMQICENKKMRNVQMV